MGKATEAEDEILRMVEHGTRVDVVAAYVKALDIWKEINWYRVNVPISNRWSYDELNEIKAVAFKRYRESPSTPPVKESSDNG